MQTTRFICLTLLLFSQISFAALNDAQAINQAGRQRMLSQRMALSYLMVASDVRADKGMRQLDESMAQFEEQMLNINEYLANQKKVIALQEVQQLWQLHRMHLLQPAQKTNIASLLEENDALLNACDKLVKHIALMTNQPSALLVDVAGRQRMLSERIAKLYLAKAWKVTMPSLDEKLHQAIELYDLSLRQLQADPGNNAQIHATLDKIASQWNFAKSGFPLGDKGQFVPTMIVVTTESMLTKNEQLTELYASRMQQGLAQR
jgi:nitrate/nitrite-specific signal transduction histidine kinase